MRRTHASPKRPVSGLAGPYGHPFHPMLVPVPIGAWLSAAVLDVAARSGYESGTLARAATWVIGVGIVGAALAAVPGLLDLLLVPVRTRVRGMALLHVTANSAALVVFVVDLVLRWNAPTDRAAPTAPFVLTLVGVVLMATGAFLGGELTFRYGLRVADQHDQAAGFRTADLREAVSESVSEWHRPGSAR
ncbi:putative membrane protein [Streptoalloteichus tenebrarius]|uniref:Membrane protein n=1 Tax=Streptoalloteichus tenebrarius (strain ATCC 17920 / DSM 40477 / JCM 4838 / CBS 697.72 / NBRC 16177 / NCIMB 11028 / NRRL B-12390 / A12253. 1 / ISP 5477) TaxID=1933 RepID=A0ABT1I2U4_STRSD|nr:DUF2231 domain-containing protein [Streptoalloteichus tenebrarius]MCP2262110.1 putative membrane protein [Streptoalloteichus tenebrarius]BFF02264.1 hypothetical protein GCM10020241_39390 [Streptoalloteichus tenebrarius]